MVIRLTDDHREFCIKLFLNQEVIKDFTVLYVPFKVFMLSLAD